MTAASTPFDRDAILDFWLGTDFPSPAAIAAGTARWFARNDALDAEIRERFGAMMEAGIRGDYDAALETPQDRLALLILLDQFPRNSYRGTAQAFAGDPRALTLALEGIRLGEDQALHPVARLFCYLPLEHSEDLAMQERCVTLFERLHDGTDRQYGSSYEQWLDYAIKHHDVIARFGRFPHRNFVLGRASSAEEQDYLAQPGAGF